MFKKAVQGLVKICFPQPVLEEIGVQVVTQHMQAQNAPEQNITKMTDVFRSEMIQRVTWMLAEYLDTPAKAEASVKAIVAANASLHGVKIGEEKSRVTRSKQQLHDISVTSEEAEKTTKRAKLPAPVKHTREGKESKISTFWRWNVYHTTSIQDISEHFKRTSDLFAYHTLPIVKQRLGSKAKRKALRQELETMLASISDKEFGKWAESF